MGKGTEGGERVSSTTPEPFLTKPFFLIGVVAVFALGHALFGGGPDKRRIESAAPDSVAVDSTYAYLDKAVRK